MNDQLIYMYCQGMLTSPAAVPAREVISVTFADNQNAIMNYKMTFLAHYLL